VDQEISVIDNLVHDGVRIESSIFEMNIYNQNPAIIT